ncbi:hypothetical protein T484DRAFT_3315226 [Baffinella frigidus]|nr:hypothetical protein T484DRAFT_3315226 [Cryptophyta sp. CCMP2293]
MARTSFEDAPPRDAANPALAPSLDPMWCGASHCADQGFARGQMMFKQKRLASTQALASYPGGRTFAGHGDSLIPHGQLWVVGKLGIVRYHEGLRLKD